MCPDQTLSRGDHLVQQTFQHQLPITFQSMATHAEIAEQVLSKQIDVYIITIIDTVSEYLQARFISRGERFSDVIIINTH